MKRKFGIIVLLAFVCAVFLVACGKDTPGNQAEIEHLEGLRADIDARLSELEAQNAEVKETKNEEPEPEVVVFTLPDPYEFDDVHELMGWTMREMSQDPGYMATRLAQLKFIDEQDIKEATNYFGTHPEEFTKLINAYKEYYYFVEQRLNSGWPEDVIIQHGLPPVITDRFASCIKGVLSRG